MKDNPKLIFIDKKVYNDVIDTVHEISEFYRLISIQTMGFLDVHVNRIYTTDEELFRGIQKAIESIDLLIGEIHLSETFSIIRKYYDLAVIQLFSRIIAKELYDKKSLDTNILFNNKVNNWALKGDKLPSFKEMRDIISKNKEVKEIMSYIDKHRLKDLRDVCNDNIHINSNAMLRELSLMDDSTEINKILKNLNDFILILFQFHFTSILIFTPHYLIDFELHDNLFFGGEKISNINEPKIGRDFAHFVQKLILPSNKKLTSFIEENSDICVKQKGSDG